MPRKEKASLANVFAKLRDTVNDNKLEMAVSNKIPSILEFVDSDDYLGLPNSPTNPIRLFPMQRLILKCVSGDNYVVDGSTGERITVRQFVEEQRKTILAFDDNSKKYIVKPVLWSGKTGHKTTYTVRLRSSGLTVRLTDDHPMLTSNGYKTVMAIGNSDAIYVPSILPNGDGKHSLSIEQIKLLAYFLGDGSCSHYPHFVSADSEPLVRDDFIRSVLAFDRNLKIHPVQQSGCCMLKVVKGGSSAHNPHISNSLWNFLLLHGLAAKTSHRKRVPNSIYRCTSDELAVFIRHLFSTDGHASLLGKTGAVIGYTTCNKELADDVCHLLRRIGVRSKVFSGNISYTYKGITKLRPIHQVRVYRAQEILNFKNNIGPIFGKEQQSNLIFDFAASREHSGVAEDRLPLNDNHDLIKVIKNESDLHDSRFNALARLRKFSRLNRRHVSECKHIINSKYIRSLNNRDVAYDTIADVRKYGEEDVYDLSVADVHNFVCNDIIVHNCFYRGSEGNEHLEFEPDEIEYLRRHGLDKLLPDYNDRGDVVGKILDRSHLFRELVLVLGRGSGKDFLVGIIASYEAMRLLETPGGDPYAKYNLPHGGNPITILTVATAAPQAELAFNEIKGKILQGQYFRDKFIPEGLGAQSIYLLTPRDREENKDRMRRGLKPSKGGIVIRAGHSNSDSLLGIQCYVLILDEVASFKGTDGSSGGQRIYEALLPALNRFPNMVAKRDSAGKIVLKSDKTPDMEQVFDSKVISISSPRGKEGILHENFSEADKFPDRLAFRLPTWVVNTKFTRESLRKLFQSKSEESFMMEFGAEFSITAGMNFFVEDRVLACIDHARRFREVGQEGYIYYVHIDPASTNNNYALAIVHKELRVNEHTQKAEYVIILDHLKVWSPRYDDKIRRIVPVMVNDVEKYLLAVNRLFHVGLVTYDMFNNISSLQMLRKIGMPCKQTHYSKQYKMKIYAELETLINEKRIILPYDELLQNELLNLQRRYDGGRGFSVGPNKEADCHTDDCADALAGAIYNCLATSQSKLPSSRLVSMPQGTLGGSMRQWNSMSGPMGTGTGQQVANSLTSRQPLRNGFYGS